MKIIQSILILSLYALTISAQQKPASQTGRGTSPLTTNNKQRSTLSTYAVVVGISDYQDPGIPDLRFADKDAEAFANYLRSNAGGKLDNDHLKILINQQATMAQFAIQLDWLMENAKENDRVIIYFSGHGDVEKKTLTQPGFLLCWDAPAQVYMSGGAFALPMLQEVISTLSIQNKAKVIVITDACRSGKLSGSSINGNQLTNANLSKQYANEIKILSCQPNEYSIEGEQWGGGRGAFSYNLVNAMYGMADQNNDLIVSLNEAGRYLEDHVSEEVAPVSQIPMIIGNRSEQLALVDAKLLAGLKAGRTNQMAILSSIDAKGIEEDVLSTLDTSIKIVYRLFKQALKDKSFFSAPMGEPDNACADSYYEKLIMEAGLLRLHSTMKRNYAAALQDDAQQAINIWLAADVQQLECIGKSLKIEPIPKQLERAAELLGVGHYMYSSLKARKLLFDGITLERHTNPDEKLGRACLDLFKQSSLLEPQSPIPWHWMSQVYSSYLRMPDSAFACARKAVDLSPSWLLPLVDLGYRFTHQHKFDLAKQALKEAEAINPNHPYVINRWAFWYNKQNGKANWETAFSLFEKYRKSGGAMYPCWHNDFSLLLLNLGKYSESESELQKALAMDSIDANTWSNLGYLYTETERYLESEAYYKKALELDSTHFSAWNNLGYVHTETGRFDKAEKIIKRAIALDSTQSAGWSNLGHLYNQTGRYEDAEPVLLKSIALDSSNTIAWNNLGIVYAQTGHFEEAVQYFKKAIEMDSSDLHVLNSLGLLYLNYGRPGEAESVFKKAIAIDSTELVFRSNLGLVYINMGRFAEAEPILKNAISIDSTHFLSLSNLGVVYNMTRRFSDAVVTFRKALALDSANSITWNNLGFAYNGLRRFVEAEPMLKKAISLDSTNLYAWSNLGLAYLNVSRYPEAEQVLKKAMSLNPMYANPYKHLGMVYFKTNRTEEARELFRKAIELNPNYAAAMLGMAYLHASESKPDEALSYVEQAINKGISFELLTSDDDLTSIRLLPQWMALMNKYFPDKSK